MLIIYIPVLFPVKSNSVTDIPLIAVIFVEIIRPSRFVISSLNCSVDSSLEMYFFSIQRLGVELINANQNEYYFNFQKNDVHYTFKVKFLR